ncbi:MAG TPA: c-type cytochrome domain-containing protein, partial [Lacunisphaera sp.]
MSTFRHPEPGEGSKLSVACAVTLGSFARLRMTMAGLMVLSALSLIHAAEPALSKDDTAFFDAKIRPILTEQCYKCHSHSADKIKGGLLLDSRDALLSGGSSGPVIVPGKPDDSLLIQALRYTDEDLRMPPEDHGGKLSDQQIADFVEWVRRGAPDPRVPVAIAGAKSYGGVGRKHWAFQPVQKP